jgi:signal transduction histidine kinase
MGFGGMRERLRQLGGTLEIHSDESGTLVRAVLPLESAHLKEEFKSQPASDENKSAL